MGRGYSLPYVRDRFPEAQEQHLMWVCLEVWETFRVCVVGALFQGQRTQSLKLRQFWGMEQLVSLPTILPGNLTANGLGFAHLDALWSFPRTLYSLLRKRG